MIHLGDITKISGYTAPTVDVIIGGSPCQDLSMAGKRAGLAGERSGLYMEQIRIIKEMRENDRRNGRTGVMVRPRYMVWENVPGAFSCNHGEDFAAVLEEAIRVSEPEAPDLSVPQKGWPTAGVIEDELGKWSVAYRVLDAQYWGVPQRRRRIALVADFGGLSAGEILFVRESVCGNPQPCEPQREEAAGDAGEGTPCTMQVRCGCDGGGKGALIQWDKSATLSTSNIQTLFQRRDDPDGQHRRAGGECQSDRCMHNAESDALQIPPPVVTGCFDWRQGAKAGSIAYSEEISPTLKCDGAGRSAVMIENHPADSRVQIDDSGVCQTLTSRMGTGGGNVPLVGIMEDSDD